MKASISRTKAGIFVAVVTLLALPAAAQEGPAGILQATTVDHNDPAVVYTSGAGNVWRSLDSGNTWSPSQGSVIAWSIVIDNTDLVGDPDAIQVIYAATQGNGVMRSENGTTWTAGKGLSGNVHSVAVHPYDDVVYAGADDGVYISNDRGLNWDVLSNALGDGITQGLVVDPTNPQVLYANKWGRGVFRSIDAGVTWQLGANGLFDTQLFDLDMHPQNASILYASTWSGVYQSVDAGVNWVALDSPARTSELAVDPNNPDRLIVTTEGNGIARSTDGGQTWSPINEGLGDVTQFVSIAIAPDGSGAVYAGSVNSGIFVSNDYGDTWSQDYSPPPVTGTPPGLSTPPPTSTPPADPTTLSIRIVDRNGEKVEFGQTAYFDVIVRNTGSAATRNAEVRFIWEQIDKGGYAMSASWSGGACTQDACNLGALPANREVVITVEGRTGDAYNWVGPYSLLATAEADNANAVSASTEVSVVRTILSISSDSGGGGANGPFLLLVLLGVTLVPVARASDRQVS